MKMIDLELEMGGDIITLNDEQKSFIDEGLKDIEERNISNEEAKRMTKEWLKNKQDGH